MTILFQVVSFGSISHLNYTGSAQMSSVDESKHDCSKINCINSPEIDDALYYYSKSQKLELCHYSHQFKLNN